MTLIIWCRTIPKYFYTRINNLMSVIIILLIASISIAGLFLFAFIWGVKTGQFEDDYSPASRILFDDKPASSTKTQ